MDRPKKILQSARILRDRMNDLEFSDPVTHVYNPLDYAYAGFRSYVEQFAQSRKKVLLLGMNPGPYGMAQTGVPFGEIAAVRDWMGIHARIGKPENEHPKKTIDGFECTRSEVSGQRLWGAIASHWKTPRRFFRSHFIANYCPLLFLESSGRNRTPDKLARKERDEIHAACDQHLSDLVDILEPQWIIGVGAFAEKRARETLQDRPLQFGRILHPSPASPKANRGWAEHARKELIELGLCAD